MARPPCSQVFGDSWGDTGPTWKTIRDVFARNGRVADVRSAAVGGTTACGWADDPDSLADAAASLFPELPDGPDFVWYVRRALFLFFNPLAPSKRDALHRTDRRDHKFVCAVVSIAGTLWAATTLRDQSTRSARTPRATSTARSRACARRPRPRTRARRGCFDDARYDGYSLVFFGRQVSLCDPSSRQASLLDALYAAFPLSRVMQCGYDVQCEDASCLGTVDSRAPFCGANVTCANTLMLKFQEFLVGDLAARFPAPQYTGINILGAVQVAGGVAGAAVGAPVLDQGGPCEWETWCVSTPPCARASRRPHSSERGGYFRMSGRLHSSERGGVFVAVGDTDTDSSCCERAACAGRCVHPTYGTPAEQAVGDAFWDLYFSKQL